MVQPIHSSGPMRRTIRRSSAASGFTLVEVAFAALVLAIALVSFIGTLMASYRMSELARRRDEARALVQSFCDRFLRETAKDNAGSYYPLFQTTITVVPTGVGLSWTGFDGIRYDGTAGEGLLIPHGLGGSDPSDPGIDVHVWRLVQEVDEQADPITVNTDQTTYTKAGRMILATFSAVFVVNGRQQTVSLSVARSDDPAL